MKRLWRASALLAGAAIALAGCSQTRINDGEEQTTTVNRTEEKVDEEKVRLDALDPSAYGNVEGLNLEAGTYLSIIGKASGGDFWDDVKEGGPEGGLRYQRRAGLQGGGPGAHGVQRPLRVGGCG